MAVFFFFFNWGGSSTGTFGLKGKRADGVERVTTFVVVFVGLGKPQDGALEAAVEEGRPPAVGQRRTQQRHHALMDSVVGHSFSRLQEEIPVLVGLFVVHGLVRGVLAHQPHRCICIYIYIYKPLLKTWHAKKEKKNREIGKREKTY